jgi:hypothetical protein
MPLAYADSSVLFAWFHPHDEFSAVVDRAVQQASPDRVETLGPLIDESPSADGSKTVAHAGPEATQS